MPQYQYSKTILIADHHHLVREPLTRLIQLKLGTKINIIQCDLGSMIVPYLCMNNADLLLIESRLPDVYFPSLIAEIKKNFPDLPIVAMSLFEYGSFYKKWSIPIGANHYWEKSGDSTQLISIINHAFINKPVNFAAL